MTFIDALQEFESTQLFIFVTQDNQVRFKTAFLLEKEMRDQGRDDMLTAKGFTVKGDGIYHGKKNLVFTRWSAATVALKKAAVVTGINAPIFAGNEGPHN